MRPSGFEPESLAWEARILPVSVKTLDYDRSAYSTNPDKSEIWSTMLQLPLLLSALILNLQDFQ